MDLRALPQTCGQSLWLDDMDRRFLQSGGFARLVRDDGLRGVTSNPTLFEKAITGSDAYDPSIERLAAEAGADAGWIYEQLAIDDIRRAADLLRPTYEATERLDGYACLEVSPELANDARATVAEARRLWKALRRENVMIKVPATEAGLPAIEQLTGEGINVNVTLLFGRARYRQVFGAYVAGLETLAGREGDGWLSSVASVASMFVSRIDVLVNPQLEARGEPGRALLGRVAIANATLTYADFLDLCRSERWRALAARGARVQRPLWASTGVKDRRFADLLYVEALLAAQTVDTLPPATLDALRAHAAQLGQKRGLTGEPAERAAAEATMTELARLGVSIDDVTDTLVERGVEGFATSFRKLLAAIERKRVAARGARPGPRGTNAANAASLTSGSPASMPRHR